MSPARPASSYRPRWEIVHTTKGWRARYRANNGLIIFSSSAYHRRREALRAIEMVAPDAAVTDVDARTVPALKRRLPIERFEKKIQPGPSGCWIWIGELNRSGYGQFDVGGKSVLAHRWSYEYHVAPIPEGLQIDHLCHTPACVNPEHLEPVTGLVNMRRRPHRTHCPKGHEFTPENTYQVGGSHSRRCLACRRAREVTANAKRRAARRARKGVAA